MTLSSRRLVVLVVLVVLAVLAAACGPTASSTTGSDQGDVTGDPSTSSGSSTTSLPSTVTTDPSTSSTTVYFDLGETFTTTTTGGLMCEISPDTGISSHDVSGSVTRSVDEPNSDYVGDLYVSLSETCPNGWGDGLPYAGEFQVLSGTDMNDINVEAAFELLDVQCDTLYLTAVLDRDLDAILTEGDLIQCERPGLGCPPACIELDVDTDLFDVSYVLNMEAVVGP